MEARHIGGYDFVIQGNTLLIDTHWSTIGRLGQAMYAFAGLVILLVRIAFVFIHKPWMNAATLVTVGLFAILFGIQVWTMKQPTLINRDLWIIRKGKKDKPLGDLERVYVPEKGTPFLRAQTLSGTTYTLVDGVAFLTKELGQEAADLMNGFLGLRDSSKWPTEELSAHS